ALAQEAAQRQVAETERSRAQEQERKAIEQAKSAKAVNDFLANDFLLQIVHANQFDAGFKPDPNITLKAAIERAAGKIAERFRDQPLIEADIRITIGWAFLGVDDTIAAIPHLEAAAALYRRHASPTDTTALCGRLEVLAVALQSVDRMPE